MLRMLIAAFSVLTLLGTAWPADDTRDSRVARKANQKKAGPLHGPDVDRFLKEHDRDGNGYLSREELPERLRHYFDKIDVNKDGKLSREELLRGWALLQPKRRPSDVVYVLVEMSDCDDTCAIELQHLYDVLRRLDRNKDGKIDPSELKAARQQIVKDRVNRLLERLDTNKDGKISRAEARAQILAHFDDLDTNKDGYIDRAELEKAASEKPTKRPATKKE
jgi:Ca2+-binding EF-hand superfamily protein